MVCRSEDRCALWIGIENLVQTPDRASAVPEPLGSDPHWCLDGLLTLVARTRSFDRLLQTE